MCEGKPFTIRKSPRIQGYDYSRNNFYFVTICTHEKQCIFGRPNARNIFGEIAAQEFEKLRYHYEDVYVDRFVVMPNHVHAIIVIDSGDGKNRVALDKIVGQYKSGVTRKIRELEPEKKVWQRSFHDHIIRTRTSYEKISQYIVFNPQKWEDDCFYPEKSCRSSGGSRPSPTDED